MLLNVRMLTQPVLAIGRAALLVEHLLKCDAQVISEFIGQRITHIDPGKPWQNGTNESFNGTFRDECLSMEWFRNRIDAKIVIEQFRRQYNEVRPHSSLGQLTPAEFKQQLSSTHSPELTGPRKTGPSAQ